MPTRKHGGFPLPGRDGASDHARGNPVRSRIRKLNDSGRTVQRSNRFRVLAVFVRISVDPLLHVARIRQVYQACTLRNPRVFRRTATGRLPACKEKKMNFKQMAAGASALALSAGAFAAGPTAGDLTNLTPDMSTVISAIGAVAVVLIGVQLAIKGFRTVSALVGKR